jgi:hypothetical protein
MDSNEDFEIMSVCPINFFVIVIRKSGTKSINTKSNSFDFELEDNTDLTLDGLKDLVKLKLRNQREILDHVPYNEDTFILGIHRLAREKVSVSSLKRLNSENDYRAFLKQQRTEPQFKYPDVSDHLSCEELLGACRERDIDVDENATEAELKADLLLWKTGNISGSKYLMWIAVYAHKNSKKPGTDDNLSAGTRKIKVVLLAPNVYLDQNDNCVMDHISDIKNEFEIDSSSYNFARFREAVIEKYKEVYPQINFADSALFYRPKKNSVNMVHLENEATLKENIKDSVIYVAFGAQHTSSRGDNDYPRYDRVDGGHYKPPYLPASGKQKAAIAQHDIDEKAERACKILYHNSNSPLFHGFHQTHAVHIKQYLSSLAGSKTLEIY